MDVEMEDAGKVLEDEVVGGEDRVEKEEVVVKEVGEKQEESPGLVNDDVQKEKDNGVEKEKQEVEEEAKEQEAKDEPKKDQEAEDEPKDQVAEEEPKEQVAGEEPKENDIEEDPKEKGVEEEAKEHEVEEEPKEVEVEEKAKEHEVQEEPSKKETEETHLNESEQGLQVEKTKDSEKAATPIDNDIEMGDEKIDATENDEKIEPTKTGDDKIVATETGDDKTDAAPMDEDEKIEESKNDGHGVINETDHDGSMKMPENNEERGYVGDGKHQQPAKSMALVRHTPVETEDRSVVTLKNELEDTQIDDGYDSGTPEAQEAFNKEVETLYKLKHLKFSPPKFYGVQLNCLKLWKAVIRLGGYDRVTATKGWRYIGEAFHPPKTCTTVSWTFRQFYEKSLLEYERHKVLTGELELPLATAFPEVAPAVEHELVQTNGHQTPGSGSGRARRDAAARAMQGWHSHRLLGSEEKNSNNSQKREKSLKSLGHKHKRGNEVEHSVKALRTETSRQVVTTVADIGPPANWVKINVRETKDCFEVYALVPGLLREEVRVQSDPAGRLVITGQPEQLDNPWGISSFKKVISLPARIDPLRTTAIVSLHGRLLVRVPFEQSNI